MDTLDKIITAVSSGELEKLKELIEKHSEMVNNANSDGSTPLTVALISDKIDETEFLLSRNADKKTCMKDGKTAIEWAKEQDNNNAAFFLIAWDYLDRLYEATAIWKKHKIKESYCDVCLGIVKQEESTMLTVDEVFTVDDYASKVVEQVKKQEPALIKNKTDDEIKQVMKEQIKKAAPTGRYIVCEDCIDKYFSQVVFGKNKDKVFEIVARMYEENS
ncbi:MAG: ankyrin repeat domain-containing protein [Spirochaetaceae bacterium]|nr:ankyrin repeat domain-containing protein [Spirochaetaceae bacterium]